MEIYGEAFASKRFANRILWAPCGEPAFPLAPRGGMGEHTCSRGARQGAQGRGRKFPEIPP